MLTHWTTAEALVGDHRHRLESHGRPPVTGPADRDLQATDAPGERTSTARVTTSSPMRTLARTLLVAMLVVLFAGAVSACGDDDDPAATTTAAATTTTAAATTTTTAEEAACAAGDELTS